MEDKLNIRETIFMTFCGAISALVILGPIVSLKNCGEDLLIKIPLICLGLFFLSFGVNRLLWAIEYWLVIRMLNTYNEMVVEFGKAKEVFSNYQKSVLDERAIYDSKFSGKDDEDSIKAFYRLAASTMDLVNMYTGLDAAYKYLEEYKAKLMDKIDIANYRYPFYEIKIDIQEDEIENNNN